MKRYKEKKGYIPEVLDKLHEVQLQILKDFINVCEKYNLTYFAVYGTAIGAVRHGGFIPWDDDIDVGMLRDQYPASQLQSVLPTPDRPGYSEGW